MSYLDVTPMVRAIRERPEEFELSVSYIRHKLSRHVVSFDMVGRARIHANCDCALLDVSKAQSAELLEVISAWRVTYWEPLQAQIKAEKRAAKINKEFANHFTHREPGFLGRLWARLTGREIDMPTLRPIVLNDDPTDNRTIAPAEARRHKVNHA